MMKKIAVFDKRPLQRLVAKVYYTKMEADVIEICHWDLSLGFLRKCINHVFDEAGSACRLTTEWESGQWTLLLKIGPAGKYF
jgi:hypothetical protein